MTVGYPNGENWTKWLSHLAGKPNIRALEIGSYEGQSTLWFLTFILTDITSNITCIDTWKAGGPMPECNDGSLLKKFRKNTSNFSARIQTIQSSSDIALCDRVNRDWLEEFDFAYIDGSHKSSDVLCDSVLVWKLVKHGGIIIWDDYKYDVPDPSGAPHLAIDAFLSCYHDQYREIQRNWQVCIEKL